MTSYTGTTVRKRQFIPCLTCADSFKSVKSLKQHQEDSHHFISPPPGRQWTRQQMLQAYFKGFYQQKVMVMRDDRKKCRQIVQREIKKIRDAFEVDFDEEADFYTFTIEPAGSVATQTKVRLANEYDYNLVIESQDMESDDTTPIYFAVDGNESDNYHLEDHWKIIGNSRQKQVPRGYATVRYVRHLQNHQNNEWTYDGFIVPRLVQEHLYDKVIKAVESNPDIDVSCVPHGPAITLRIRPSRSARRSTADNVKHDIFVDFAACIKVDKNKIPVSRYGWPRRPRTLQCLDKTIIARILDAGVYLVPKDNSFWYISFSNAAKILMKTIDTSPDTCRRMCHKILKTDFHTWESEQAFPGISTFIFKNHLFWFNENLDFKSHNEREEYWNESRIGECYMDLLKDFSRRLLKGNLPNYFNEKENILAKKKPDVLRRLSNRILMRVDELERIILSY